MRICIARKAEINFTSDIIRVLDALIDAGHEVVLLTSKRNNKKFKSFKSNPFYFKQMEIDNIEIPYTAKIGGGMNNLLALIIFQIKVFFWFLFNARKYDVIHAFDLDMGLPALLACKITKKEYVYHISDFYIDSREGIPLFLKKYVKKLEYQVINNSFSTIICTEERKEQIRGSKPKKLFVIHNSPIRTNDQNIHLPDNAFRHNEEYLLLTYVGTLSEKRFIRQSVEVVKNLDGFRYNIAGLGPLEDELKKNIKNIKNIRYLGKVPYDQALSLYSICDIMFAVYDPSVPNHKYSAPNKVYEAMMFGKPIIVARGTGIDKLVEKEGIGIVIDYNKEDFKRALNYFIREPDKIREMGERAQKVYHKYSWDTMKKKFKNIYDDLEID